MLLTEADLTPNWRGYGRADAKAQDREAIASPGQAHISYPGAATRGAFLEKRVRRLSADRLRRIRALEVRIAKLQREHGEAIAAAWGDSIVLSAAELVAIARQTPPWGTARDEKPDPRGPKIKTVEQAMEPWMNALPPELYAAARKAAGGWCSVHGGRKWPGCKGCA